MAGLFARIQRDSDVLTNSVELTKRAELLQHPPSRAAVVQPHRAETNPNCKLRWLQGSNLLPPPGAGATQQASTNATKLKLRPTASNGQRAWRDWRETRYGLATLAGWVRMYGCAAM